MSSSAVKSDVVLDPQDAPSAVIELLAPLTALEENWDGYGALAPTQGALKVAADVLGEWTRGVLPPQVMPSVGGGVLLEWETRDVDLVIDVAAEGGVSVYVRACGKESEGSFEEHRHEAEQALALLALTS